MNLTVRTFWIFERATGTLTAVVHRRAINSRAYVPYHAAWMLNQLRRGHRAWFMFELKSGAAAPVLLVHLHIYETHAHHISEGIGQTHENKYHIPKLEYGSLQIVTHDQTQINPLVKTNMEKDKCSSSVLNWISVSDRVVMWYSEFVLPCIHMYIYDYIHSHLTITHTHTRQMSDHIWTYLTDELALGSEMCQAGGQE